MAESAPPDLRPFSQREGFVEQSPLQITSLDAAACRALVNVLTTATRRCVDIGYLRERRAAFVAIASDFATQWNLDVRVVPRNDQAAQSWLVSAFEELPWHKQFDALEFLFVEFVAHRLDPKRFQTDINAALQRCNVGWRMVRGRFLPFTSELEGAAVAETILGAAASGHASVEKRLRAAADALRKQQIPDFRASIRESIEAVEAAAKIATGDDGATLEKALKQLQASGSPPHAAQLEGWRKLYAWTSDGGIRHARKDEPPLEVHDALYMLVSCSAFARLLLIKAGKWSGAQTTPS